MKWIAGSRESDMAGVTINSGLGHETVRRRVEQNGHATYSGCTATNNTALGIYLRRGRSAVGLQG